MKSSPCSPQLEKACVQQQRLNAAKKKKKTSAPEEIRVWWPDRKAVAEDTVILPRSLLLGEVLTPPAARSVGCGWLTAESLPSHCPWLKGATLPKKLPPPDGHPSSWAPCGISARFLKRCLFPKHCPINYLRTNLHLFPREPRLRQQPEVAWKEKLKYGWGLKIERKTFFKLVREKEEHSRKHPFQQRIWTILIITDRQ